MGFGGLWAYRVPQGDNVNRGGRTTRDLGSRSAALSHAFADDGNASSRRIRVREDSARIRGRFTQDSRRIQGGFEEDEGGIQGGFKEDDSWRIQG
jgi:hypothetical protein